MKDILVVEDVPQAADFLVKVATTVFPQSRCQIAYNLHDAQKRVESNSFFLVLLDIGLPDGSGLSLFDMPGLGQSLMVVTTIFDDDKHVFDALSLGAQGYLLKDEPLPQLVKALEGIHHGQLPLSASIAQRILASFRESDAKQLLSPREREVLVLLAKGLSNKQVADTLALKPNTVASYIKVIYQKLSVCNRAEATSQAIRMGLLR